MRNSLVRLVDHMTHLVAHTQRKRTPLHWGGTNVRLWDLDIENPPYCVCGRMGNTIHYQIKESRILQ